MYAECLLDEVHAGNREALERLKGIATPSADGDVADLLGQQAETDKPQPPQAVASVMPPPFAPTRESLEGAASKVASGEPEGGEHQGGDVGETGQGRPGELDVGVVQVVEERADRGE